MAVLSEDAVASLRPLGLCCLSALPRQSLANPVGDVVTLMQKLYDQVKKDGEMDAEAYGKFAAWCEDSARTSNDAVKTGTDTKADLEARITKLTSDIEVADTKVGELGSGLAEIESELKKATYLREKEHADFAEDEKDLMEMIEPIARAVAVLEKQGSAALAQLNTTSMANLVQTLGVALDAASFSTSDRSKLLALVQSKQAAEDEDAEDAGLEAPAAAAYEKQSRGIVAILEDMKEDAESQLAKLRKTEEAAQHEYDMLKMSLEDRLAADNKDMSTQKERQVKAKEDKAEAEGDLKATTKNLKRSAEELKTIQSDCLKTASDYEKSVAGRKSELGALQKAIEILQETSGGAASFLQVSEATASLSRSKVIIAVRQLAKKHHSAALAQLASSISAALKHGASSRADPFAKVKGLIKDMIFKLEKEMASESKEKAYCDSELKKSGLKYEDLSDDITKMDAAIDSAASRAARIKEEMKKLQDELAALAKEQAVLDGIRTEAHADYEKEKADLKLALHGVRQALGVLRDYYGSTGAAAAMLQKDSDFDAFVQQPAPPQKHSPAANAGGSVISFLQNIEADFAENLAKLESGESDAQSAYEKITSENTITTEGTEAELKHDEQDTKALDTTITETKTDEDTAETELSAVEQYLARLKARCIGKAESFEERAKRREAEIQGLKEALAILKEEAAAFLQRRRSHRGLLRGHAALEP